MAAHRYIEFEYERFLVWIEHCPVSNSYNAYIRFITTPGTYGIPIAAKSFGNGVRAEEWILDQLMYPEFVILSLGK